MRARIEANLIIHVEGDHFLDEQDVSQAVAGWLDQALTDRPDVTFKVARIEAKKIGNEDQG